MKNFMRDQPRARRLIINSVGAIAASLLNCSQLAANFTQTLINPIQVPIPRSSLSTFLTPLQMKNFGAGNVPLTLYLFPAAINQFVVIAVRDNCNEKKCTTALINLSAPNLPNSTVVDNCNSDLTSAVGINGKIKFGFAYGAISANCANGRKILAPNDGEGFSEFVNP